MDHVSRHGRVALRLGSCVVALGLLLGACGGGTAKKRAARPTDSAPDTTIVDAPQPTTATGRIARRAKPYDLDVRAAVHDIEQFWAGELPKMYNGTTYEPLAGGLFAYSSGSVIPQCGEQQVPYRSLKQNAFYCPFGDFIAWDDEGLFPDLQKQFGTFTIATVLAHEWGHAIQKRVGGSESAEGYVLEQQADCFAGAWVKHLDVAKGMLTRRPQNLDAVMAGFIKFRDFVGVTAQDPGAHGSAFDRIRAFQEGFEAGTAKCKTYLESPPDLVELPFRDFKERFRGGNAPFEEVVPIATGALTAYWKNVKDAAPVKVTEGTVTGVCKNQFMVQEVADAAMAYCADTKTIIWNRAATQTLYDQFGDFAVATVLAEHWALAIEARGGMSVQSKASRLEADCLTGAWAGATFRTDYDGSPTLSPGDLDESVQVFLALKGQRDAKVNGSVFDQMDRFRTGFFGSNGDCQ